MPTNIYQIETPGGKFAPCKECHHEDCLNDKALAAMLCPCCHAPIGYDRKFILDKDRKWQHQKCEQSDLDAIPKEISNEYPELDRLSAISLQVDGALTMLEWLDSPDRGRSLIGDLTNERTHESIVYDCFGIDDVELEDERRRILKRYEELNQED